MDSIPGLIDKVAATGPLVAFQLIILIITFKFFQKEMSKKDEIIKTKDQKIEEMNDKHIKLTERFIEVTLKNNELISDLKDLLHDEIKRR